jgi:hypothetical protein
MRQDELFTAGHHPSATFGHLPVDVARVALGHDEVDMAGVRKKPPHFDEDDDEEQDHPGDPDNEAPETPTDEPAPVPIRDPPSHDAPKPPLTVRLPDVRSV